MAGELSGILEHVDRIGKLDLEGVEPTSHVVALENVLRADVPWPSLPPEVALSVGAGTGRRGLPGSLAAGRRLMAELLELTAPEARRRGSPRASSPPRSASRPGRAAAAATS